MACMTSLRESVEIKMSEDKQIKQKELEKKYMELQILSQRMKQLQQQIVLVTNQITELAGLQQSLSELKDIKHETKILMPFGNGIYMHAMLENPDELLVNVGAGVVVKKDLDATKEIISQQEKEMKDVNDQMMIELKALYERATSLEQELQSVNSE